LVFLPVYRLSVKRQTDLFSNNPYLITGQMFILASGLPCEHTTGVFHLGDVVRKLRRDQGLTLVALSARAGVSKTTLSELERKGQNFERQTLVKIASALGVSEVELYDALREQQAAGNVRLRKEDGGDAGADTDDDTVDEEEDAHVMPDQDQIHAMTTALRLAPPERRDEFIQHCFTYAMSLRQGRRRATGTGPNG
jgi:transcriptional regulator with XRE-family HTH domain